MLLGGAHETECAAVSELRDMLNLVHIGLRHGADAIIESGITSIDALLEIDAEREEQVLQLLDEYASPNHTRAFSRWLQEERDKLPLKPPPGSLSAHFYSLTDRLNDSNISDLEAATILRVDDPIPS